MSRCFPYPPPGYARNGVRDEALIESIKKEAEKAQKERKEEKKRRKREKEKAREEGETSEKKKHHHKRKHRDGRSQEEDDTRGDHNKKQRVNSKHAEKSNLTEEHGQPVSSQNSTDSTLNSSKGQETPTSLGMEGRQRSASIIRIQLPLQRQKDPDVLPNKEQPCSSAPGRTMNNGFLAASQNCGTVPQTSWERVVPEKPCSTSSIKGRESAAPGKTISNASMAASRNGDDRARPEKPSSTSLKGQESSAPGRTSGRASLAASQMRGTGPQTSSDGVCFTSSLKSRESSAPGKTKSNASLAASQMCGTVPRTSGARTGQEKSFGPLKTISSASLSAPQVCGIVPRNSSGHRTGSASRTSEDRTGQEQSSIPGRTISEASLAAPHIHGSTDRTSGDKTKPEQPCSPLAGQDSSALKVGKEENDLRLSSGAATETSADRAEASSALITHRARPSSSELKYAKLVENWVPPTFVNGPEGDLDDQEWLLQRKQEDHSGAKEESKVENGRLAFTHGSSLGPWPRVCLLPEADIYALPYTVPY
ncbi:zinc finger CCCH domain-containing protein 18-like [Punica granatum]|uniref:Zinc finger CCCH domain-containing protein 18-like n=2 Tax=Punica granatum TaxID=22663 RepID=A0A6P8E6W6_PUNGR|nr:zinc finger CCCH domain-containing protein 18-like [Punica granatum]PKI68217.1 hypothetical protein CRG98_011416 [Punica granatum]